MAAGRLAGKIALITGAARGIGRTTAERFHAEGATVVAADIAPAATGVGGEPPVRIDVTQDADWRAATDALIVRHGRLDVLVNNAGIVRVGSIEDITDDDWTATQRINVDGVMLGCRHGVRVMKATGGAILNMSSVSGLVGGHNLVAYNASKGAVRLLTKSVALHCARKGYGIRCNSVHPAFVETGMLDDIVATAHDPRSARGKLSGAIPLGRVATPGEIADLLVYLASDESAFVTGAELVIDGGLTAG
jgi:NAD(P)-dependent dehydrogenase (short-subunit alcohol dehydrogenase family)